MALTPEEQALVEQMGGAMQKEPAPIVNSTDAPADDNANANDGTDDNAVADLVATSSSSNSESVDEPDAPNADADNNGEPDEAGDTPPGTDTGADDADATDDDAEIPDAIRLGDREIPAAEVEEALALKAWGDGLDANSVEAIGALLSGDYILVPRAEYEASQSASTQQSQSNQPADTDDDTDDYLDPRAAAEIAALKQQVGSLTQTYQQTAADDMRLQINAAKESYAEKMNLNPTELAELESRLVGMRVLPALAQNAPNYQAAVEQGLDLAYWNTESFRERELDTRLTDTREEQKVTQTRKRKASALSGSGGSVSRSEKQPAATPATRLEQMAADIRTHMSGGQAER